MPKCPPTPETPRTKRIASAGPYTPTKLRAALDERPATPHASRSVKAPNSKDVQLSLAQKKVLRWVEKGRNVFFTGSAGTGKSFTLRAIINRLRSKLGHDKVVVTAPTGVAAVQISGMTLHSWAGVGYGRESVDQSKWRVNRSRVYSERWRSVHTLVIDEISMVDAVLFDKLEEIARFVRRNNEPFGGIQLVISGDFFQLPPVPGWQEQDCPAKFTFEAVSWERCIDTTVILMQVFRQKDRAFVDILNAIRAGNLTWRQRQTLLSLSRIVPYDDGIEPTELYATRQLAENSNRNRLDQIKGEVHEYEAQDWHGEGYQLTELSEKLSERFMAVRSLTLKVGAQVMLIRNLEHGRLVNGSVGRVIEFLTVSDARARGGIEIGLTYGCNELALEQEWGPERRWPVVEFADDSKLLCVPVVFVVSDYNGDSAVNREQIPLILAWALTIHKSQGLTIERVRVDLLKVFAEGQAYVALSRATSLDTLEVRNFTTNSIKVHPRVLEWYLEVLGPYYDTPM